MSFHFSADGDHAAFLHSAPDGGLGVGTWSWQAGTPRRRILSTGGESHYTQPLPLGDGRVLALRSGPGVHDLVLLAPGRDERHVGRIESRGLGLLPTPEPGTMAVARGLTDSGATSLWLIRETSPRIEALPTPRIPAGSLRGGRWLDSAGRVLGFDHHCDGQSRIVAVDLATGVAAGLPNGTGQHDDYLLLTGQHSGRFLAARNTGGQVRLGWGAWHHGQWQLAFPDELSSFHGSVTPLAIDPSGSLVALCAENGTRTEIYLCAPGHRRKRRLGLSPGMVMPAAGWTAGGLHLATSDADRPRNISTVTAGLPGHRSDPDPAPAGGWAAAHAEVLSGPAGGIEAVIYGGSRWRESPRLLVALHGGPHAMWKLGFDPLFQDLAAAGTAVVAPNQRGSTGYGSAHRDAIRGAWGGPDLDDILHIAGSLSAYRQSRGLPALMIFGVSYGAFLALLAAAAAPALWSCCVAIAPFASAPSLYADGSAAVKSFLDRLGALDVITDALGPRDLGLLAGRITCRLLIVHGSRDETIPVTEPRRVIAALERAGRRNGADFVYHEIPAGHDLLHGPPGGVSDQHVVDFLTQPPDGWPAAKAGQGPCAQARPPAVATH